MASCLDLSHTYICYPYVPLRLFLHWFCLCKCHSYWVGWVGWSGSCVVPGLLPGVLQQFFSWFALAPPDCSSPLQILAWFRPWCSEQIHLHCVDFCLKCDWCACAISRGPTHGRGCSASEFLQPSCEPLISTWYLLLFSPLWKKCLEKVPEGRKTYFDSKIRRGGSLLAGKARLQSMEWLVLPLQWSGSGKSK